MFLQFLQELITYPFTLPILLYLLFLYKTYYVNGKKNQPPSPPKLPIVGNLHQIGELPHQSFASLSKKFGKIMLLHFGSKPILVVSSSEAAREIFKTHDLNFCSRPESLVTNRLFNGCRDVAFSPYSPHWRMMKSLCITLLLNNKKVQSYKQMREEEVALIIKELKISSQSSCVVNISAIINEQTYDLICRAAFGRKYGSNNEGGIHFKELLDTTMVLLGVFFVRDYIPWLGWIDRVRGWDGRLEEVAKQLDELRDKVIEEHKDSLSTKKNIIYYNYSSSEQGKNNVASNFVEMLLEEHMENKDALTMDDIKAIILNMFAAGADTTYTLLEWTMAELLRNPRVMKQLQEEVRKNVGDKGNILKVNEDDLERLTYLKAVIKESLRLHPPAPLLVFRQPSQDAKIDGFDVAAGTRVFINAWAIHRDPNNWEDPMEFRPERFMNTNGSFPYKGQDDFRYIPFGGGRRICPGIAFAITNAELMLANFVYEFDWKMPPECVELDMTESVGITVHKREPLMIIPTSFSNKLL